MRWKALRICSDEHVHRQIDFRGNRQIGMTAAKEEWGVITIFVWVVLIGLDLSFVAGGADSSEVW